MTIDQKALTRPIIGIENRTAQEVFDIMCDRFLLAAHPAPDHAGLVERLRTAYAKVAEWPENRIKPGAVEELGPGFDDLLELRNLVPEAATALSAQASPASLEGVTDEQVLASEILAELTRARTKFPGKNVTFAALVEEVGELATATFEESSDRVRKEAVQVAVMAMRMVLDGDHTFDDWRAEKGLDPLSAIVGSAK
ncbi:hypothetical protein [Devosia ginsengisoli]|uniref:Uncharacterized protein n=1 Tax=Devosia ginsengisoli TaxID=400770 RepID=A0A5B8LQY6_9HYPH|nr:hypothetical protein [Devosia ginsengisoli]QDZ10563.1 hypothetical protein FPZ08_07240 [Devosia ginsengisoli]